MKTKRDITSVLRSTKARGRDDGLTLREIQDVLAKQGDPHSILKTRGRVREAIERGDLEAVRKVTIDMSGRPTTVPAYRVVTAKRSKR